MALGRCRDMNAALSLAASLISGDAVTLPKGEVARTRYVVIHFAAGAPSPRIQRCACGDPVRDPKCMNPPMITDQDCELLQYQKQLSALTAQVREAGASGSSPPRSNLGGMNMLRCLFSLFRMADIPCGNSSCRLCYP